MKTFFLKAVCITIMLHSAFGLFAQRDIFPKQVKEETTIIKEKIVSESFGKAPLSADRKAYTDKPFNYLKGEYSEALICISEDLGHFIISNPEVYESYGVTIPEFINSGEYYQGLYYYASSTSGLFGTIDPSSGTISQLASGCPFGSVAYNPIDDQMYGISLGNAPVLYTVNTSNGAATQTTTCEGGYILGLTIDNDGRFFIIDTDIDGLCEINPATGAVISIWPADFTVNYGQDVSCDRETNTIYWAAYNADAGCSQLYSFDPMGGYTLIGAFSNQASCFAIKTVKNLNAASAPTNLTITPDPYEGLSATLSWTNPTTTIGGAPLSSIQNIIVKRDGVIIQEYNNPGVGANMTYVNVVPTSGTYVYTVYAVTSEGDGISAGGSANVGEFCTFIVYGHDSFGDGWNMAAINFDGTDGSTLGTFTVTSSETTKLFTIPKGTIINCVWIAGIYDSEVDVINITTLSGSTIFSSNSAPAAGIFHTFANNCTLTIPNAPTDFAVIENPDNNLSAILSWTNPSTCKDGSILNMISATVMRNGEIIHSINNPVNGANETFTDNTIPEAGCYIYIVYVTNSEGISDLATETVYIGIYPMQYCETVEISTCSGIVLDNGAYNNYLNNSNDIMIIHSSSPGACVVLSGPYSIETGHDKLRIYDGTGTNGTLLNTYSNSAGGIVEEVSSATTGSLTLHFTSDGNVRRSGFELTIACAERVPVSGNVTVASSGAPIAGANISFNGIGGTSVTTDSYGNYSISLIPDTFDIIVEAVGYNTIVETGFVIPESGINNKNFVMTTPTIAVNPTSVSMSCGYMGEARKNITITNDGDGPLTWDFKRVFVPNGGKNPWDLVDTFSASADGMQAVATNGDYIYLASWQGSPSAGHSFEKYNMDLGFVKGFDIEGISELKDLTYDGQYFYCGVGGSNLYCLDLDNETLVGFVTTKVSNIRHCSYDATYDGFWVGNWTNLYLIDREGTILITGPAPNSAYGSGYDEVSEGGPYLLLFCQPNSNAVVYRYNIATNIMETEPVFDFSINPGYEEGTAGGAFVGEYKDKVCFFGNLQQEVNLICIHELSVSGTIPSWLSSEPLAGIIEAGQTADIQLVGNGCFEPGVYNGSCLFRSWAPAVGDAQVDVSFIIEDLDCPEPTNLSASYGDTFQDIVLTWDAPSTPGNYTYNIYKDESPQSLIISAVEGTTYTFSNMPIGIHSYVVRSVCENGGVSNIPSNLVEVESSYCNLIDMCYITINMFDLVGDGWDGAAINITVDGNNYGNVTLVAGSSGTATIHICPGETVFTWIEATWDEECSFEILNQVGTLLYSEETGPEGGVFFISENTCDFVSIDNYSENICNIYPNPANTEIIIEGYNIAEVMIYNIFGQLVEKTIESFINTSAYANGIYMVFVKYGTNKVSSHKIVIAH